MLAPIRHLKPGECSEQKKVRDAKFLCFLLLLLLLRMIRINRRFCCYREITAGARTDKPENDGGWTVVQEVPETDSISRVTLGNEYDLWLNVPRTISSNLFAYNARGYHP